MFNTLTHWFQIIIINKYQQLNRICKLVPAFTASGWTVHFIEDETLFKLLRHISYSLKQRGSSCCRGRGHIFIAGQNT